MRRMQEFLASYFMAMHRRPNNIEFTRALEFRISLTVSYGQASLADRPNLLFLDITDVGICAKAVPRIFYYEIL